MSFVDDLKHSNHEQYGWHKFETFYGLLPQNGKICNTVLSRILGNDVVKRSSKLGP